MAGDDPAGPDRVNLEGLRVLIVGDDGEARDTVARELSGRGAAISTASSSEQAVGEVAAFAPDAPLRPAASVPGTNTAKVWSICARCRC